MKIKNFYNQPFLEKTDRNFLEFLQQKNSQLASNFLTLRHQQKDISPITSSTENSKILIEIAKILEEFLAELFGIKKENNTLKACHDELQKIYAARREFVQRIVSKKFSTAPDADANTILAELKIDEKEVDELEKILAQKILEALTRNDPTNRQLELLSQYSALALYDAKTKFHHRHGALFILPKKIDHQNLIEKNIESRCRKNFDLTDKGFELNRILAESHYCIFCHNQGKDSCRTGLKEKDFNQFKRDPLKTELHGCPLEEKISEMNLLKSEGFSIAALAMAIVENPMIAATGHRICNDCMKSCIYQKQDAVDIPQIETRTLKDVLQLPFGFEIYSLLTRWNPLNLERPLPKNSSGKKILVVGLGPAGFTLAHHLLNEGHEVVAIDGLKIEPLNPEISGIDAFGNRQNFRAIKFLDEIYEPLSSRLIGGFGGVVEYGITSRFDKNFLKIIRLLLERRENFRMFGGIRFGSSITDKIAFDEYGFDHVALCMGAGRPRIIGIKNNLAKGVRLASDFLMSLQLTGAFKEELFTNLQIRLPIVVIGGGLTAVDTACEAAAYYIVQVRKFAKKIAILGKEKVFLQLNPEEKIIAEEFLQHARELETSTSTDFFKKHGAAKILYRKKIQDSPAYRLNHQELNKAFEEGVEFVENITPLAAEIDEFGAVKSLTCADEKSFECRSVLVAAGTMPNISPAIEDHLDFALSENGRNFTTVEGDFIVKIDPISQKSVSFFGDMNPNFEGNVVKAMASAKRGYKQIGTMLENIPGNTQPQLRNDAQDAQLGLRVPGDFLVKIKKVERVWSRVIEVTVHAPLLAKQTKIGHIFRLQNYHAFAQKVGDQLMAMEGIPLTVTRTDATNGEIEVIALETGGSASLIQNFKAGEPCIFMGPSGEPNEIPKNENVVLIGGGRGNQPLMALSEVYKANGCKVFLFVGYLKNEYVSRQERMEKASEALIYAIDQEAPNLELTRPQDRQYHGNLITALKNFFQENPQKIDRVLTMGNNRLMAAIADLRRNNVVKELAEAKIALTSLNAPMQCMLKGVCAQCLQKKTNESGEEELFYACSKQDVDMDRFDFKTLHQRCEQNALSEKVARMWIEELQK
jgi:NADPH-dependent glutamate synthase beta subunit-like oxidoreductase/NAD(P)H-flavin reductase/cyanate lyase